MTKPMAGKAFESEIHPLGRLWQVGVLTLQDDSAALQVPVLHSTDLSIIECSMFNNQQSCNMLRRSSIARHAGLVIL